MAIPSETRPGPEMGAVSEAQFLDYARRHATSPEIGRIATCLDDRDRGLAADHLQLLGLSGCGRLCGVACCTLTRSDRDGAYGGKLDSVIVENRLRRRGLASLLVARSFLELLSRADATVSSLYAHAVHPATMRLLRRLSFSEPPILGAPLSALRIDEGRRAGTVAVLVDRVQDLSARLKLQCAFCKEGDRRARPWCARDGA